MLVDLLEMMEQVAACVNVKLYVIREGQEDLPEFDLGLRKSLVCQEERQKIRTFLEETVQKNTVYYVMDFFENEYCFIPVPAREREYGDILLLGPYRDSYMTETALSELMESRKIPLDCYDELNEYYRAIPIVSYVDQWRELLLRFARKLYGPEEAVQVQYLYENVLETDFLPDAGGDELSSEMIERRYAAEGDLIRAVSGGSVEEAMRCVTQLTQYQIRDRFKDPNRNLRNLLITANTLLRKAVETACVHPVHIDRLSDELARKIETVNGVVEYRRMFAEMVRKYCLLVKNYSLRGHSPVIQKVVNHIHLNLTSDLSLKCLSETYSVNASYLSALFRKEMGVTVTDYINQQRIHRSINLLNATNMQIQDIASECGIYDVNYFRRLFKKIIGRTPTEYAKAIRK